MTGSNARAIDTHRLQFGTREKKGYGTSRTIVGHEYAHLIVAAETRQHAKTKRGNSAKEYGAVNEGLADTFGMAQVRDWRGMEPFLEGDARNPASRRNVITQYSRWKHVPSSRQPHLASGIVSNAAVDVQKRLGWDKMERIFYGAIQDGRFGDKTGFQDLSTYAMAAADRLYGPTEAHVVRRAFQANGIASGTQTGNPANLGLPS